ncbi:Macrophage migration inhibitory factor (MIF) [Ceratocystis platani]|uniref:L-dopachrome isomerase n=1 Tax=Ceratocystis fimbriata f. sp. platani TaxID=88771 RepID=A0A0F8DLW5_CERFI|nr:Macrophage migration inhibitory factor (MIF) [Ceratocystis platani]
MHYHNLSYSHLHDAFTIFFSTPALSLSMRHNYGPTLPLANPRIIILRVLCTLVAALSPTRSATIFTAYFTHAARPAAPSTATSLLMSALQPIKELRPGIVECIWPPQNHAPSLAQANSPQRPANSPPNSAVVKVAATEGQMLLLAHEAAVYHRIEQFRPPAPIGPRGSPTIDACLGLAAAIAPKFLGHVIDPEGRAVGFVLEKVDGRHARRPAVSGATVGGCRHSPFADSAMGKALELEGDTGACRRALERLHLLVCSAVAIALDQAQKNSHTTVGASAAVSVLSFISAMSAVIVHYTGNSASADTIETWSCKWNHVSMLSEPHFGDICLHAKATAGLAVALMPLQYRREGSEIFDRNPRTKAFYAEGYGHQVPPVISPRASIKMSTNAYGMPLVPQTHEYTGRVSRQSVIKPRSMIYGQSSNSSLSASFDHMGLSLSKQLSNLPMSNTLGELDVKHAPHGIDAVDEPPEDEDFIRQTSMVMVDLLTNVHIEKECPVLEELTIQISKRYKRPVSSIAISLRHGACMVYGGSMDPAYILTLYAEPSQVLEATNRRNTILLQRVLRDTLTVPPSRGTIRFVAVPDECLGHNNTTLRNEIKELQRQRQQHQVKRGREHEREPRSVSPAKKNLPTTPVKAKPVDLKQSRSLLKMKSLVGIRPVMMDPVSSSANPDINDVSPPRHSTDNATSDSEAGGSPGWRMPLAPRTPSRRVVTSPMQVSPTPSPRPAQTQPQPQAKGVDNDRLVKSKKSFVSLMFGRRVKGDGSPLKNENVPPV